MNSQKYDQQDSDHGTKKCSFFNKTLQEKKRDGELNKTAFSCINSIYSSTKNNKTLRDKFNQRGTENYKTLLREIKDLIKYKDTPCS